MSLDKRYKSINLYIPADFEQILKMQIDFFVHHADFNIHIHPIECQEPTLIHSDEHFEVMALPLEHRVPCCGFLFREKQGNRHIKAECIDKYGIPRREIQGIREGRDFTTADGQVIPNEELTTPPDLVRSYAYLSDTRPMMEYTGLLQGVDLIYHDATYCESDEGLACQYDHSTASEAAEFAKKCGAGKLLLGHFSSRYGDEAWTLNRAAKRFPRIMLADEGLTVGIVDKTENGPLIIDWKR